MPRKGVWLPTRLDSVRCRLKGVTYLPLIASPHSSCALPPEFNEKSMEKNRETVPQLWSRLPARFRRGILVAIVTSLIGWSAAWSQVPPPSQPKASAAPQGAVPADSSPTDSTRPDAKDRLREGTELQDARGYFRLVHDRVVFFRTEGESRFVGLENLNLERIVAEITNNPTQLEWTVVGTITEYRGTNYLLVRRAILSRSAPASVAPTTSNPVKTLAPVAEPPKPEAPKPFE